MAPKRLLPVKLFTNFSWASWILLAFCSIIVLFVINSVVKGPNSFLNSSLKLDLKKKELVKLLKKLIKSIYKHRGTNRKQFLFLKKYNLTELEDISFKTRKLVKENKIK